MKHRILLAVALSFFCSTLFVFSQETVEDWQAKAVAAYPDLGVAGSVTNLKFIQMVNYLKVSNPAFFNDPKWPYTLAQQIAKPAVIPGLGGDSQAAATPAPVSGPNPDDVVDAAKLAADYAADKSNADGMYLGKKFCVTGHIARITAPDDAKNVALVYLDAGKNLPCVKVELNKMKKYFGTVDNHYAYTTKNGYELRVSNDATLEVRSHTVKTGAHWYIDPNTHVKSGEWVAVISKGEAIKIVGTCTGKIADVVMSSAELIKDDLP